MKPTFTKVYGTQRDPRREEIRMLRSIDTQYSCVLGECTPSTVLHSHTMTINVSQVFDWAYTLVREREEACKNDHPNADRQRALNLERRLAQLTTLGDDGLVRDGLLGKEHALVRDVMAENDGDSEMTDEHVALQHLRSAAARVAQKVPLGALRLKNFLRSLRLLDAYEGRTPISPRT